MKRNHIIIIMGMLMSLIACQQETLDTPKNTGIKVTFEAKQESPSGTKTQIGEDKATDVFWSVGDAISVYCGMSEERTAGSRFRSTATEPALVTSFSGTLDLPAGTQEGDIESLQCIGVYPYGVSHSENGELILSTGSLANQIAKPKDFPKNSFYSIGRSTGINMPFYNVFGGICFTLVNDGVTEVVLKGNNDEILFGDFSVAFDDFGYPTVGRFDTLVREIHIVAPGGGYFSVGVPYYLVMLPTVFEKGFTISFKKDELAIGTRKIESRVEIARSQFSRMTDADKGTTYHLNGKILQTKTELLDRLEEVFGLLFTGERGYCFTNYGTDEFMVAADPSNAMWNDYDARLAPKVTDRVNGNTVDVDELWRLYYQFIGVANEILCFEEDMQKIADLQDLLGKAFFVRAFSYLSLVGQYGDVPLVFSPIESPSGEFSRDSRESVYSLIISDLEKAYQLVPADPSLAVKHKLSRYAVAHYLAKAHLWRASEINDDWNAAYKSADLAAVIDYADEVITAHPLVRYFDDLFGQFTGYDTSITETNTEIVLSKEFYDPNAVSGSTLGNQGLSLFTARYQVFPLMKRDLAGAREYQRLKTTPSYAYFLYDLENDSRFWKSFKTTYAVNNASSSTIYVQGTKYAANQYFPSNDGEYLSSMYIINRTDYGQKYYKAEVNADGYTTGSYTRVDYRTGKYIPNIMALFVYDENDTVVGTSMTPDYGFLQAPLNKYLDGAVNANNRASGYRDGILARSAEDYFFKAEAQIRQGNIDAGLATLKPLRDRAQFRAGEPRDAYVDGGNAYHYNTYKASLNGFQANCAFYPMNSYYYSIGGWDDDAVRTAKNAQPSSLFVATSGNYPKEDEAIIAKLGYTTEFDKAMCFLLNEKSREMYGEYHRWMDLARTKTLEKRLIFNDQSYSKTLTDITGNTRNIQGQTYVISSRGGSFQASKHYLRPIPQSYLDGLTRNGEALTTEEKQALQNPGY